MILTILEVVLPVFLVIGAGYVATRTRLFAASVVDGLMVFTQSFAIPCLLFVAIMNLDLGAAFDARLLFSFYAGAVICFALGIVGARLIFRRRPGEAVSIGFSALYSNSVLLGLPIMERAYGADALAPNFAIVSLNVPICYFIGITVMEFARADGRGLIGTARTVLVALMKNALLISLMLGFVFNLGHVPVPVAVQSALEMVGRAALPAALFGLGGILARYSLRASLGESGMILVLSLVVHPAIGYVLAAHVFGLSDGFVRAVVVTASMAPGVNSYIFASLYGRGQEQAASSVLLGTGLSVLTISVWLTLLGGVL